jgi:hypothetical protein
MTSNTTLQWSSRSHIWLILSYRCSANRSCFSSIGVSLRLPERTWYLSTSGETCRHSSARTPVSFAWS